MESKNKNTQNNKVASRNKNKNKNKTLQNRAKERVIAKKQKAMRLAKEVNKVVTNVKVDVNSVRDDVMIVPDRPTFNIDNDYMKMVDIKIPKEDMHATEDITEDGFVKVKINKFRFIEEDDDNSSTEDKTPKFLFSNDNNKDEEENLLDDNSYYNFSDNEKVYDGESNVKVETIEEAEKIIPRPTDNININAKKHFSFESRVVLLVIAIILSFVIATTFIAKAVNESKKGLVTYDEKSDTSYKVCINEDTYNQYYENSCLNEDMEYLTGISERIPTTFKYNIDYSKNVDKELTYSIVSKVIIAKEKNGKVLNSITDPLVNRASYHVFSDKADLLIDVDIPVKKYIDYTRNYNLQYGVSGYATLEVTFVVDNGKEVKEVSKLEMPLSNTTYSISKTNIENKGLVLNKKSVNSIENIDFSLLIVGLIFVLLGLLAIIKLSDLVYKCIGTTNLYQKKLNRILREYDSLIVIARGEYTVDESKRLVKVLSFGELLDARSTLEKPIVYLKVNNVKSEFYVEDSETIYKYTMKEADFGGK